jgi:hypothetical protein
MNTIVKNQTPLSTNYPVESLSEKLNDIPSVNECLSFWASDSALAFEYFHIRLRYNLIEISQGESGICTMCFSPADVKNIFFYVHYNQEEEHHNLLADESDDYLELPKKQLKLVPVNSEDAFSCQYISFNQYE